VPLRDLADSYNHEPDPHKDYEDKEDSLSVEGPLRTIVIVALTLIDLNSSVPLLLIIDESAAPIVEDAR
jgi:hypothetical protein